MKKWDTREKLRIEAEKNRLKFRQPPFRVPGKNEDGQIDNGVFEDLMYDDMAMIGHPKIIGSEGEQFRHGRWTKLTSEAGEGDLQFAYLRKKKSKKSKAKRKTKKCKCK
jgi:hypothetical protein